MARIPEVHWSEGMFLRPHHLQLHSRWTRSLAIDGARLVQPNLWGVVDIDVAEDQLEAFTFAARRLEVVFRDGTWVRIPTGLRVEPRSFRRELDASGGRLPVHFGIPFVREGEPNTSDSAAATRGEPTRWRAESLDVVDENAGGAPRAIEIRKVEGRFFFGDEDRAGWETIPLALLERTGQGRATPVLSPEVIPAALRIGAWPHLKELADSVVHRLEAKFRFLRAEVAEGRIALDAEGTGGWQPILKLHIVGSFLPLLRQMVADDRTHPYPLYLEFCRLAGELSIFAEGGVEAFDIPLYDHERLGECFTALVQTLEKLLETILSGRFVRVDFEVRGELLTALLRPEWLIEGSELYLAVESDLRDRDILARLETAKLGTSADIPLLKQRRLFGLDIQLLKRAPGGLPTRDRIHYFAVSKEGSYWDSVVRQREISISGGIDPQIRFALYIVLKPEKGDGGRGGDGPAPARR